MTTPNLGLPELIQSQSGKEITHNQALRMLDVLVPVAVVQDKDLTTPPAHVAGNLYIIASSATGDWENKTNQLAYSDGLSWWFIAPKQHWNAFVADEGLRYRYNGSNWVLDATGNVLGSPPSTDNAWARFNGTAGNQIQNGKWVEADSGHVTAGGDLNLDGHQLKDAAIQTYSERAFDVGELSGDVEIDIQNGNMQHGTLTGDVTFSISHVLDSGQVCSITLELKQDATGGHQVTFPAEFKWAGSNAPTLSTTPNAVDILVFYTRDGGETFYAGPFGLSFG